MRKLDLRSYKIQFIHPDGSNSMIPYLMRESIEQVILATGPMTSQRLSMSELLRNARVAQKITLCKDDFVLLEEDEYQIVRKSFDAFSGFGKNDVEMCRRIIEAETIEVEEKMRKKT